MKTQFKSFTKFEIRFEENTVEHETKRKGQLSSTPFLKEWWQWWVINCSKSIRISQKTILGNVIVKENELRKLYLRLSQLLVQ